MEVNYVSKKRLFFIIGIVLLVLIIGFIYYFFNGSPNKKSDTATEVKTYLMTERTYKAEDFQEIDGVYSFKYKEYQAIVKFKDEPNVNYTYAKVNGKFKLVGTTNVQGKHMDSTFNN
ncbi:DUF3139 domain-containing protein [Paenibacillus polymyxa]|nr:DUF3139 domain-containing protein [Paenibacillus polymyxa]